MSVLLKNRFSYLDLFIFSLTAALFIQYGWLVYLVSLSIGAAMSALIEHIYQPKEK